MDVAAEIEALEHDGWTALSGMGGVDFYERVMADDGLMVFPGAAMDKRAAVRAIRDAAPWSSFDLTGIRVAGDDRTAVIVYRATARRGDDAPYVAEMSSVYVKRDGRWLLLLHQQSPP